MKPGSRRWSPSALGHEGTLEKALHSRRSFAPAARKRSLIRSQRFFPLNLGYVAVVISVARAALRLLKKIFGFREYRPTGADSYLRYRCIFYPFIHHHEV